MSRIINGGIVLLITLMLSWGIAADHAQAQGAQPVYLTPEILMERTTNLVQQEGRDMIDLSNLIIDLSSPESELSQNFYRQLPAALSGAANPVNLNFSNSLIQGAFYLNRLGIDSPLGSGITPSLFDPEEQKQIQQYFPASSPQQPIDRLHVFRGSFYANQTVFTGLVDGSQSLFLQPVNAKEAKFQDEVDFSQALFGREVSFNQGSFAETLQLSASHFFSPITLNQGAFDKAVDLSQSQFEAPLTATQAQFSGLLDLSRCTFIQGLDLSQAILQERLILAKGKFLDSVNLRDSSLEKTVTLRDIYLNATINLQDVHLLDRLDFSNAFFTPRASINASGLAFDSAQAQVIGQPGVIGKFIRVDRFQDNETVLRNLIRNFRQLEQVADANYLEYQQQKLRSQELGDRLTKTSWCKVLTFNWLQLLGQWLMLSLLLLLGDYGTNINLLFTVGLLAIAFFSLIFWLLDRYRPGINQPILPSRGEIWMMVGSYSGITLLGLGNIFFSTDRPWSTLVALGSVLLPLPLALTSLIYRRGRYHPQLDTTYFMENGGFREFRLLLGRLPIMPRFDFFRDRYLPILWERRWSWLNYYDFSLNNIFKLGFNDIRLRDQNLPGLITTLVWYQWCWGVLYIVLLLWTLSRTIPGLNLLIYF